MARLLLVPGGRVEPPRYQVPADFECDAARLQVLALQHFLRLTFYGAARSVRFGVVLCGPVAHTLRTPTELQHPGLRLDDGLRGAPAMTVTRLLVTN
jgi:hypothetical protein